MGGRVVVLVGLLGRSGARPCPNLPQRRSAAVSAAKKSAEYQRFFSRASARSRPLWQILTTRAAAGPCEGCRGPVGGRGGRPLTSRRALCTRKCSSNRRSRVQNAPLDEEGTGRGRSGPRRRPPWNISSDLIRTQCMLDLRHHGCTPSQRACPDGEGEGRRRCPVPSRPTGPARAGGLVGEDDDGPTTRADSGLMRTEPALVEPGSRGASLARRNPPQLAQCELSSTKSTSARFVRAQLAQCELR